MVEDPQHPVHLAVSFGKTSEEVVVPRGATLAALADALAARFGVVPDTIKLLLPRGKAALKPLEHPHTLVEAAGAGCVKRWGGGRGRRGARLASPTQPLSAAAP